MARGLRVAPAWDWRFSCTSDLLCWRLRVHIMIVTEHSRLSSKLSATKLKCAAALEEAGGHQKTHGAGIRAAALLLMFMLGVGADGEVASTRRSHCSGTATLIG